MTYRPEIDGLRAFAVLSVIISHFDRSLLPGGHLGVDIFFVISGFVITQSLVSRQHESFGKFIQHFYNRRVKRLLPALILSVAVTFLLAMMILNPESGLYTSTRKTAIAALFGVSNFYLLHQATDYFGASAELNPFTHTWSLGVEEQFYLLFPFLLWLSGLQRKHPSGTRTFVWIIAVTGSLSLGFYVFLNLTNPVTAFYLMPARFWELAAGAIAFAAFSGRKTTDSFVTQALLAGTAIAIIAALFIPHEYGGIATILVVLFTSILITALNPSSIIYRLLTLRAVIYLGTISYSLYLWHWSVLTISRLTVGVHGWTVPVQLVLIFLLAALSYHFVEKPLRQTDWSWLSIGKRRAGAIGHAFTAVILTSLLIYILSVPYKGLLYAGKPATLEQKGVETLMQDQNYRGKFTWQGEKCVLTSNQDVGKTIIPENCSFGDPATAQRRFLVIGNSFSAAELEMFKILADNNLGSVTLTASWGASAVPEIELNNSWSKANQYYWSSVIPSLLKSLKSGDIVILINDGKDFTPEVLTPVYRQRFKQLQTGLGRLAEMLEKRGISLLYQQGTPFIIDADCTPDTARPQWWNIDYAPPCRYYSKEQSLARRQPYDNLLMKIQDTHANFFLLDIFDVLCPTDVCRFFNDQGVFLYRDEYGHPSVEAAVFAQEKLMESVNKIIERASP